MAEKIEREHNKSQNEKIVVPCAKCSGKTNHVVLLSADISGEENSVDYYWSESYQIIQCRGCQTISFRTESSNSEDYDEVEGGWQHAIYESLYPSRIKGRAGIGNEIHYLPTNVHRIYQETLSALNNNLPVLTGVGLRALVEAVCKEKMAQGNNLFEQIGDLVKKNVLTPTGESILHKIRTLGNKAAHEVKPHDDKQLALAMDVIEHLLKDVYILPKMVEEEFDEN